MFCCITKFHTFDQASGNWKKLPVIIIFLKKYLKVLKSKTPRKIELEQRIMRARHSIACFGKCGFCCTLKDSYTEQMSGAIK